MRWLVDECVDAGLVELLNAHGYDAIYMTNVAPRATDTEVMQYAESASRLLLTKDKDFGDLIFHKLGWFQSCASSYWFGTAIA